MVFTETTRQRGGKFRKQFSLKVVRQILVKILSDTILGTLILFLLHLRGLPVELGKPRVSLRREQLAQIRDYFVLKYI